MLSLVRSVCPVEPLTIDTHDKGRAIAVRNKFSVYDAMIVASALLAKYETLYSDDMHDGLLVDSQLHIRNPFSAHF